MHARHRPVVQHQYQPGSHNVCTGSRKLYPRVLPKHLTALYDKPLEEIGESALRRMMISVAGVVNRKNILLDEPFAGHDPEIQSVVMSYLRTLASSGHTVLLTTGDTALAGMCDKTIEMGI